MGSLKALQEWCRIQCEDYNDVEIKNMSTSFRDGLAFCAIIHRYRPDLIDFSSLSKENVYENNKLAFEVAETQLGIPALLDPEDMVSMTVPDRLSIITYVSQYYNFFTNKSHVNPPCMKRPGGTAQSEPAQKRPVVPLEDKVIEPGPDQTGKETETAVRGTLSSSCAACQKHVHLVQRFLVDGKLYHRNCFRCRECSSTLLPGSYKLGKDSGSLVCLHHFTRPALTNQNGGPDLSNRPAGVQSVRIGRIVPQQGPPSEREQAKTPPPSDIKTDPNAPVNDSLRTIAVASNNTDALEQDIETMDSTETQEDPHPSPPSNPFDESDHEEEGCAKEEAPQTAAKETANGNLPATPVSQAVGITFPVPAPRRIPERTPPPRPAPRVHSQRRGAPPDPVTANGERQKPTLPPKPRERSQSPGSLSSGTPKPKDPPWLALVQAEPRKKPAPPPPPPPVEGQATPPHTGSLCSLKGEASGRGAPPPAPANPFEEEEEEEEEGGEDEGAAAPPVPATSHPWYSITQVAQGPGPGPDAPPGGGSSPRPSSPKATKGKKRPAPRVPKPPSSSSPSQALSMESLSSGSEHSTSQAPLGGSESSQEPPFSKSASEPSISRPSDSTPSPCSSSAERLSHLSLSPSPGPVPPNASSAPATPQSSRSAWTKGPRPPPPRPPATPSPLASGAPSSNSKRTCKENPFNRKASPSHATSKIRPPQGPRPARPPAPGHGFPLIKRKVQTDQYIPVEDIHVEMSQLEQQLDELEQRGVELERKLRDNPNDEEEEHLLVDWFTLIHEKHLLVRREAELVYTAKQQNLEERQADVEYELRCLLNKPEKEWNDEDKGREQELMADLVTIIEQRNQIINSMDLDRQREEEEDRLMAAVLKKKDFHKEPDREQQQQQQQKKKGSKFKPIKVLKRLSHKGEPGKGQSPHKDS